MKKLGDTNVEIPMEPDPNAEVVGQVFKTLTDKFVGTLSFIRIYSGTYKPDQPLFNARTGKSARTGGSAADARQAIQAGDGGDRPATSSRWQRSRTCTSATR